ncbi:MAG: PKD domain-containing protein [Candidatus Bipolaricaulota bacterium]
MPIALGMLVSGCVARNTAPLAEFLRTPRSGDAPLSVLFDASASMDPDGQVVSYSWTFGDGASGEGETTTHTFDRAGAFSVTLLVKDDLGASGSAVRAVDVREAGHPPVEGTEVGQKVPDIVLPDVTTGDLRPLSEFRGYVVLLEFWRSTCSPCRTSLSHMETLRARYAAEGLLVVTVSSDVTPEAARQFLVQEGYGEFVGLHDTDGAARSLYHVDEVPHTFLIDRQGIVRHADHPIRFRDRHITPWL